MSLFDQILNECPKDGGWVEPEPETTKEDVAEAAQQILPNFDTYIREGEEMIADIRANKGTYIGREKELGMMILAVEVMVHLHKYLKQSTKNLLDIENPEWEMDVMLHHLRAGYVEAQREGLVEIIRAIQSQK